ncbi:hypothetical protein HGO38_19125 [Rhizobium sp. CG5]|uniref:hypothetical protein n=1 Tax=Rhizobium sp. CG5 TaxID=2726076 RepID=UPI0020347A20|nr:hypothetical protein [Rhizobium sp. CG5]MCM2475592.1 hypothetical protein [Rhizobium sp. CG5]
MGRQIEIGDIAPYIILIVGLIAIAGTSWSTGVVATTRRSAEADQDRLMATQRMVEQECSLSGNSSQSCASSASATAREELMAEAGLAVQRELADIAFFTWIATLGLGTTSLILSAAGIWWVKETLVATQRSAEATAESVTVSTRAVQEARETNRLAEVALILEQRPWLAVELTIDRIVVADGRVTIQAKTTFRNAGSSPAFVEDLQTRFHLEPFMANWNDDWPPSSSLREIIFKDQPATYLQECTILERPDPDFRGILDVTVHARYKMNGGQTIFETRAHFRTTWDQSGPLFKRTHGEYLGPFETTPIYSPGGMT